jgi:hypothetical protein
LTGSLMAAFTGYTLLKMKLPEQVHPA